MKGGPAVVQDALITSGLRNEQNAPQQGTPVINFANADSQDVQQILSDIQIPGQTSTRQNGAQNDRLLQRQTTLSQNFNNAGSIENGVGVVNGQQPYVVSTFQPTGGSAHIYTDQNGQSAAQTGPQVDAGGTYQPLKGAVVDNYNYIGLAPGSSTTPNGANVGVSSLQPSPQIAGVAGGGGRRGRGAGGAGGGGGGGGFGGGGGGRGATTRTYPNSTAPGPVTVDYDPEGQKLVVLTDDKSFEAVSNLVRSLDQPRGQIVSPDGKWQSFDGTVYSPVVANSNANFVDQFRTYNGVLPQSNVMVYLATGNESLGMSGSNVTVGGSPAAGNSNPNGWQTYYAFGGAMATNNINLPPAQTDADVYSVHVVGQVNVPVTNAASPAKGVDWSGTLQSQQGQLANAQRNAPSTAVREAVRRAAGASPPGQAPVFQSNAVAAATYVQDGRYLYEAGHYAEAEAKFNQALAEDRANVPAAHFMELIQEKKDAQNGFTSKIDSVRAMEQVTSEWDVPQRVRDLARNGAPNAYAPQSNAASAGPGRKAIFDRLHKIPLGSVNYTDMPLKEVLDDLSAKAAARDPDGRGINFFFSREAPAASANPAVAANGKLVGAAQPDAAAAKVSVSLKNVTMDEALDAILKTANQPLKYSVSDNGIIFSSSGAAPVPAAPRVAPAVAEDRSVPQPPAPLLVPQPETLVRENAFSTFSLNVSDVAFKLSAASLQQGRMPDPGSVRSEEFINAFDYRDPDPAPGQPVGFAWERARYPFAHNRDLLRFSIKTASAGRQPGRPLNLVLLLDNSGSMERADRVAIIHEALRVLATQLQPGDKISIVTFSRTARLWVDGIPGDRAGQVLELISELTPEGGTNLGDALDLAYATALRHYMANGVNRVVVLTDGAANLGNVNPETLKLKVQAEREQGIALDCFGIGWEDYNDDLLEVLTRNGDGRYGFINTPEDAAEGFAGQLAGALHVAASDVKVQVEFNPNRVISYRQIGYAKHQLTKEQFRDNTVHAAQIGAAEAGNGLYTVELNPQGTGPICTVRLRYRDPGTSNVSEHAWDIPYNGEAAALDQASPAMRLAATASAFSEWLAQSPFAGDVTTDQLLNYLNGVPAVFGADTRAQQLEAMIRQAKSLTGK